MRLTFPLGDVFAQLRVVRQATMLDPGTSDDSDMGDPLSAEEQEAAGMSGGEEEEEEEEDDDTAANDDDEWAGGRAVGADEPTPIRWIRDLVSTCRDDPARPGRPDPSHHLDVYRPRSGFRKSDPGPPDFCVHVARSVAHSRTPCRGCIPPPTIHSCPLVCTI